MLYILFFMTFQHYSVFRYAILVMYYGYNKGKKAI